MIWPSRKFWQKLGFEVSGTDDNFTVDVPGWAWGTLALIALLIVGAILNVIFG